MKLHDDYYEEEHSSGSKMTYVYMALIMSVVILGVTALVFWANQSKSKSDGSGYAAALAQKEAKAAEENKKMEANASENVNTKVNLHQMTLIYGRFQTQEGRKILHSPIEIMVQLQIKRQVRRLLMDPQVLRIIRSHLRLRTSWQMVRLLFMI